MDGNSDSVLLDVLTKRDIKICQRHKQLGDKSVNQSFASQAAKPIQKYSIFINKEMRMRRRDS